MSNGQRLKFENYFGIINEAMSRNDAVYGGRLLHEAAMKRLNAALIALKHHGTPTARLAAEQLGVDVTRFFEDNTPLVFGIQYRAIPLVSQVLYEPARQRLHEAVDHLAAGNMEQVQNAVAIAFAQLIRDYKYRATACAAVGRWE